MGPWKFQKVTSKFQNVKVSILETSEPYLRSRKKKERRETRENTRGVPAVVFRDGIASIAAVGERTRPGRRTAERTRAFNTSGGVRRCYGHYGCDTGHVRCGHGTDSYDRVAACQTTEDQGDVQPDPAVHRGTIRRNGGGVIAVGSSQGRIGDAARVAMPPLVIWQTPTPPPHPHGCTPPLLHSELSPSFTQTRSVHVRSRNLSRRSTAPRHHCDLKVCFYSQQTREHRRRAAYERESQVVQMRPLKPTRAFMPSSATAGHHATVRAHTSASTGIPNKRSGTLPQSPIACIGKKYSSMHLVFPHATSKI